MDAFTVINHNLPGFDPSTVATALFGAGTGITFDPATFEMVSGASSAAFYDGSLALGIGAGLLITSGTMPGATNTAGYFGVSNGMAGDPMLDAVVNSVFPTVSLDATTIAFSFTVDDPSITGVSFNIVFGSDEYPEWVNQFVDIGAIWVNGVDVAYFNNDKLAPLSVIGSNLSSNYFMNNTGNLTTASFGGVARPGVPSLLPIEYDGVSRPLSVFAPVHQGVNTLKIGIADTRDHIYDSGLFISNMLGTSIPVSGITRDIDGTGDNDSLQGSADAEDIRGNLGDDEIKGAGGDDVILAGGGDDYLSGGAGDDYIDGGAGRDAANYAGAAADYAITANADGSYRVADLRTFGPDGVDTLRDVEIAQFADVAIELATMQEVAKVVAPVTTIPAGVIAPPPVAADEALPAVTAPLDVFVLEDGEVEDVDAFANIAADGTTLVASFPTGGAPAGVSYDATTHHFLFDAGDASFQSLAVGETTTVTVDYNVTNSVSSTAASAVFTVTGVNDAPSVGATAPIAASEGGVAVVVDALATASDVDHGATLAIVATLGATLGAGGAAAPANSHGKGNDAPSGLPSSGVGGGFPLTALPDGVTFDGLAGAFVLDPGHAAFQSLAAGQVRTITIDYGVTDGIATTPASATFVVTGTNDAPVVSGPAVANAIEDGGGSALTRADLLANVTDVDAGDTLSVAIDDLVLPAGVTYHHVPGYTTITAVTYYGFSQTFTVPTVDTLTIDTADAAYQSLAVGEARDIAVNYSVSDGTVSVPGQAVFHMVGSNDAPVVAGPLAVAASERGATVTIDGLANATDIDHITTLSVVAAPPPAVEVENFLNAAGVLEGAPPAPPPIIALDLASLPAGVSFDAATNSFTLDPNDPAYLGLTGGQVVTVTVDYGVSDGIVATAAQAIFTVTGTNSAPVVTTAVTTTVHEDGGAGVLTRADLLGTVTDADGIQSDASFAFNTIGTVANSNSSYTLGSVGDRMTIQIDETDLPAGVTYNHADGVVTVTSTSYYGFSYTEQVPAIDTLTLDSSNAAYQSLADGEQLDVVVPYTISDGTVTVPAQAIFHVIGTDDAPVISAPVLGAATEDGAIVTLDGLATATDIDHGAQLSVVATPPPPASETENFLNAAGVVEGAAAAIPILPFDPATLPAGVSFNAATNSFAIDPSDAAYQFLSAGQTTQVVVNYGVSDGILATAASLTFTVTGTNDAPTVSGPAHIFPVLQGAGSVTYDLPALLANAHDVDQNDRLDITLDRTQLPDGVTYSEIPAVQVPEQFIPGFIIPAGPRGTSWGGYIYPAVVVPDQTIPAHVIPARVALTLDPAQPAFRSLAQGETRQIAIDYNVTDGTATVGAQAIFTVTGINDAPVVSGPQVVGASEDGAMATIDALANASDVDHGTILVVVAAPPAASGAGGDSLNDQGELVPAVRAAILPFDAATLPAGVSFDAAASRFTVNPADPVFQDLSEGQVRTITIHYGVSDGLVATAATATFTVTGRNDLPVVTSAQSYAASEDGVALTLNPFANASDVDQLDVLRVVTAPLPAGLSLATVPGGYYQPDITVTRFNPGDAVFQSLAQGEVATVVWNYDITDGHATVADSASFTVTGVNDAPAITGLMAAVVVEDGAGASVDGLSRVVDVDHGATIAIVGVPAILPAGVSYDAASHSFAIDPANATYQPLAQGATTVVSVSYGVSDGMVTTPAHVDFTVIGVNDAPVVTGPTTGTPNEDGTAVSVNALGNSSDVDDVQYGHVLHVTGLPALLPAGVTFDAATQRLTLDPTNAAYQSLSLGENRAVVVGYNVSDGYVEVPTSVIFTVSGRNDAPTVSGTVQVGAVSENAAPISINLLANSSDVDALDTIAVKLGQGSGVTASVTSGNWAAPVAFGLAGNQANLDPGQFNALGAGETVDIALAYTVTDGNPGGTVAAGAHLVITGANDAPTAITLSAAHIAENSPAGRVVGTLGASDADRNDSVTFSLVNDANGFFAITGNSLVVAPGAAIDFETTASDSITVRATDAAGASVDRTMVIAIDNVLGVTINGSSGNDTFTPTAAVATSLEGDTVDGKSGNDLIDGGGGADQLDGGSGNDTILGGDGNDTITGGVGADSIFGGDGNDRIIISGSDGTGDVFSGGAGTDTLVATGSASLALPGFNAAALSIETLEGNGRGIVGTSSGETFDLSGISLIAGSGMGFLDAGDGADAVTGTAFADDLRGAAGADTIHGGTGNDSIDGGAGTDRIYGDAGNDLLKGGADADRFVFDTGFGKDTISDFVPGAVSGHDVIDFGASVFASFGAIQAAMTQAGADVVIAAGADTITLKSVNLGSLVAADFAFH